ncbi:50S ribosomal protein L33 [Candidatus Comchoanobacter bicostacola]|uniref:Large ribosomal subunit protein bL33 n=1 Tax=Candidatus Comchoanobacter bicostacola TaxID=2919598 RepID=A0ABY5DLE5_9GAMM|nr:50S ribosomal protein L33 [Candidatus Comchoanobacter bicostacola]UTC24626.1 50S ribosomal protein L33 [Candidatus Comchoanobacter bicostacola]
MARKKPSKKGRQAILLIHKHEDGVVEKSYATEVNTQKQKMEGTGKLKLRKFSKRARKHVLFTQDKV